MEKMTREQKKEKQLLEIRTCMERQGGIIRTAQLETLGIDYRRILKWVDDGTLTRVKNGYYSLQSADQKEEEMIAGLFPDAVLCLESALYYYHYSDRKPLEWQLAVDKNTSKSRFQMKYPLVRPHYTEKAVLEMGVTSIEIGTVIMKIYNKERMICDCLKFEEKLEREIFKKALISYIGEQKKDIPSLLEYARERKVLNKVQNMIGVWL